MIKLHNYIVHTKYISRHRKDLELTMIKDIVYFQFAGRHVHQRVVFVQYSYTYSL